MSSNRREPGKFKPDSEHRASPASAGLGSGEPGVNAEIGGCSRLQDTAYAGLRNFATIFFSPRVGKYARTVGSAAA